MPLGLFCLKFITAFNNDHPQNITTLLNSTHAFYKRNDWMNATVEKLH